VVILSQVKLENLTTAFKPKATSTTITAATTLQQQQQGSTDM